MSDVVKGLTFWSFDFVLCLVDLLNFVILWFLFFWEFLDLLEFWKVLFFRVSWVVVQSLCFRFVASFCFCFLIIFGFSRILLFYFLLWLFTFVISSGNFWKFRKCGENVWRFGKTWGKWDVEEMSDVVRTKNEKKHTLKEITRNRNTQNIKIQKINQT